MSYDDEFIDRVEDTDTILNQINNNKENKIFLSSKRGVGKSTLVTRLIRNLNRPIVINCEGSSVDRDNNVIDGNYISLIVESILKKIDFGKYPTLSIEQFYTKRDKPEWLTNSLVSIYNSYEKGNTLKKSVICLSVSSFVDKHNLSKNTSCENYRDHTIFYNEYIKYIMDTEGSNIILYIDNMENIDEKSKTFLFDEICKNNNDAIFIFEYTINDVLDTNFIKWREDTKAYLHMLRPLDSEDSYKAINAIKSNIIDQVPYYKIKEYYEKECDGNLLLLSSYVVNNAVIACDPIYELLCSFDKSYIYMLAIIILNTGEIKKEVLRFLLEQSSIIIDCDDAIKELIKNKIVALRDNQIICNSSVIESWNANEGRVKKYMVSAYPIIEKFYINQINNSVKPVSAETIQVLMNIYKRMDFGQFETFFTDNENRLVDYISPSIICSYLNDYINYLKEDIIFHQSLLKRIVIFSFNYNVFKFCLKFIDILEKTNKYQRQETIIFCDMYKINCYQYLERYKEAIKICEEKISNYPSERDKFRFSLLHIGCLRAINNIEGCKEIFNLIDGMSNIEEYPEYGIELRLKETYLSRGEAVSFAKKSVDFYENKDLNIELIKSKITYSFLCAVTTDIDEAIKQLKQVESLLDNKTMFSTPINLNNSSINMLKGNYGEDTINLLQKARLNTESPFDKLLINVMLLICYFECNNNEKEENNTLELIEFALPQENDKHLLALVYYNLYLYYNKKGDQKNANNYLRHAKINDEHNDTVAYKIQNKVNESTHNLFLIDWCIGFTFFWNVDYLE